METYKELVHITREGDNSQDLQSASWRTKKSQCFNSSPKAGKDQLKSLLKNRQEEFPLTSGRVSLFVLHRLSTDWIMPTHTLGKIICCI